MFLFCLMPPAVWEGVQGWTYAFDACKSNFLDCYFLDHSPCPKIHYNVRDNRNKIAFNRSRLEMPRVVNLEMRPKWWTPLVGGPSNVIPERSIRDLDSEGSVPSRMVFYSYFFRPNYFVRRSVHHRVKDFDMERKDGEVYAAMHVRRGDVLLHKGQARFYIPLETYVRGSLPFLRALGVTTILLLTDSQAVIDEALVCEEQFPEVCRGLSWRFVEKSRWQAAEGGWENPFPSGSSAEEFMNIQVEFSLAQRCDLMIMGNSGFGDMVYNHMCCGFPLHSRGVLPQRCVCPPKVRLEQGGFTCAKGNKIMCGSQNRGGSVTKRLDDPANMLGANFSMTRDAYVSDVKVWLTAKDREKAYMLSQATDEQVRQFLASSAKQAKEQVCKKFSDGPTRSIKNC
jgi:hypothetical protein